MMLTRATKKTPSLWWRLRSARVSCLVVPHEISWTSFGATVAREAPQGRAGRQWKQS